jgi:hypothetical protein
VREIRNVYVILLVNLNGYDHPLRKTQMYYYNVSKNNILGYELDSSGSG